MLFAQVKCIHEEDLQLARHRRELLSQHLYDTCTLVGFGDTLSEPDFPLLGAVGPVSDDYTGVRPESRCTKELLKHLYGGYAALLLSTSLTIDDYHQQLQVLGAPLDSVAGAPDSLQISLL